MERREALKVLGGAGLALGGGKAADNVLLGYGVLVGTNLREQELSPLVSERLGPSPFDVRLGDKRVEFADGVVRVGDGERERSLAVSRTSPAEAAEVDAEFDLAGGPTEQLVRDLPDVRDDECSFEFSGYETFFDRFADAETCPFTVEALRSGRFRGVDAETVSSFAGVSPTDTRAVVEGLARGFREHTYYDVPRYTAGSIQDNVIFGAADLRRHFESPTSFEALERGENAGMFCYEFTHRSVEALQAVPAHRQTVPVFGGVVYDTRHKHVYTAIGSAYRTDGELVLPVTFVDYTHSTLYDDVSLRWLLGEGIDAYDRRHRATHVFWH